MFWCIEWHVQESVKKFFGEKSRATLRFVTREQQLNFIQKQTQHAWKNVRCVMWIRNFLRIKPEIILNL